MLNELLLSQGHWLTSCSSFGSCQISCLFNFSFSFLFLFFSFLSWQVELEVTLPGDGRDRTFSVILKFAGFVSLALLEQALEGRLPIMPFDAIQALDVIMRHLPSMT